ncbi:MAG: L-histidine N(alpha)-methyltransferase [Mucilaginibacter polytrichastri]|nr:L-histidine N(alpha)-methyltransferase [Mucilaginibacter polytrichastri]
MQAGHTALPEKELHCIPNDVRKNFALDILEGLNASPRHFSSKYFYDEKGDKIFQQIMSSPEYYLTKCETEILSLQADAIADTFHSLLPGFDLVELGAGDCAKTKHLLNSLLKKDIPYTFYPVDISSYTIADLENRLPKELPGIKVHGICGEFFEALDRVNVLSSKPKAVLFLGSTIGNMNPLEGQAFFQQLSKRLNPNDLLLTGFDLQKNPHTVLHAYDDAAGLTKAFNLNLLERINRELDADFNLEKFDHWEQYDVETGACKSYLISLENQTVTLGKLQKSFDFENGEYIFTEISQKYTRQQIADFALNSGFVPVTDFMDEKGWFVDALWQLK